MISRKIFGIITIYCIVINAINCDQECDNFNDGLDDKDCKCLDAEKPHSRMLLCKGKQTGSTEINSLATLDKKDHNFSYFALVIQETNVEKIEDNAFAAFEFEQIFIENNPKLISLSNVAFDQTYLKNLVIRNNPILNGTEIFGLAKKLLPRERIEFEGNKLIHLPKDAFGNNSNIKYIFLQNNQIEEITDEKIFKNLPNLIQVGLNNNSLTSITMGLEFYQPTIGNHDISVFLHQNKLSETKLNLTSQTRVNVKLFLEDNNFKSLRMDLLKNFLSQINNELYFHNNNFDCTNDMLEWVPNCSKQIHNVWCSNYDESIFRVPTKRPNSNGCLSPNMKLL